MLFRRAMSEPGRIARCSSLNFVIGTLRGRPTMIFAPLRKALIMRFAMTGWVLLGGGADDGTDLHALESRVWSTSSARTKMAARPATVGECQSLAQWSTLFVPTAARMNFWKR